MGVSAIRIMCPNLRCRAVLAVPAEARGRMVRCQSCGSSIKVPAKREPQPPSDPEHEQSDASPKGNG